jgi:hypothetical protein
MASFTSYLQIIISGFCANLNSAWIIKKTAFSNLEYIQKTKKTKTMESKIMNIVDEVKEDMTSDAYNKIAKALQSSHVEKNKYVKIRYALTQVDYNCEDVDKPRIEVTLFNNFVQLSDDHECQGTGQFHFEGRLSDAICMFWQMKIREEGIGRCFFEREGVAYVALILEIKRNP